MRGAVLLVPTVVLTVGGCALDIYHVTDPSSATPFTDADFEPQIKKAVKCEVITFIVENKLRSDIVAAAKRNIESEYQHDPDLFSKHLATIRKYPYMDVDAAQWAYASVDLKKIVIAGLTAGYDWKKPSFDPKPLFSAGDSKDWHLGPALTFTSTGESTEDISIPQYDDLGPKKSFLVRSQIPEAAAYSSIYFPQPDADQDFYCYKSLSAIKTSKTEEDAASDVQNLVENNPEWAAYVNFHRIFVPGTGTLAQFLQDKATNVDKTEHHVFDTTESVFFGQYIDQFSLEIKPSMDLKWTLVAQATAGLIPDLSGSIDSTTALSIYLNEMYASSVLSAKNGDAKLGGKLPN